MLDEIRNVLSVYFSIFHFLLALVTRHSLRKNIKKNEMKNGKKNFLFSYTYNETRHFLKVFAGTFHRAQILKLRGMSNKSHNRIMISLD